MLRNFCMASLLAAAGTVHLHADEPGDPGRDVTKILVTFSDAGMSNAARAGPAQPGYTRRTSSYLISVGVRRAANRVARDFNLVTLDEWPIISLKVHCLVYGAPDAVNIDDLLARLRQRPEVESAQLMNEFEVSTDSISAGADPYAELQHNVITLELAQAHRWSRGDGTTVSIIDTGADFEHPELRARIASHRDFVESEDGEFSADVHGTAVAGVIGAEGDNGVGIIGVAPSTELSVLKACWHRPDREHAICNTFTLAKALNYAIESGTDIINLSLNGPSDALLRRLVELALERGIVVVAAAPEEIHSGFPVEIAGVIVVGSNDPHNSNEVAARPFVKAPGADILVPVPRGGYDFASGTSLAAAHVSGIVALLVARRPGLTANEITSLLVNSQLANAESVNACRALAELLAETGCATDDAVTQRL